MYIYTSSFLLNLNFSEKVANLLLEKRRLKRSLQDLESLYASLAEKYAHTRDQEEKFRTSLMRRNDLLLQARRYCHKLHRRMSEETARETSSEGFGKEVIEKDETLNSLQREDRAVDRERLREKSGVTDLISKPSEHMNASIRSNEDISNSRIQTASSRMDLKNAERRGHRKVALPHLIVPPSQNGTAEIGDTDRIRRLTDVLSPTAVRSMTVKNGGNMSDKCSRNVTEISARATADRMGRISPSCRGLPNPIEKRSPNLISSGLTKSSSVSTNSNLASMTSVKTLYCDRLIQPPKSGEKTDLKVATDPFSRGQKHCAMAEASTCRQNRLLSENWLDRIHSRMLESRQRASLQHVPSTAARTDSSLTDQGWKTRINGHKQPVTTAADPSTSAPNTSSSLCLMGPRRRPVRRSRRGEERSSVAPSRLQNRAIYPLSHLPARSTKILSAHRGVPNPSVLIRQQTGDDYQCIAQRLPTLRQTSMNTGNFDYLESDVLDKALRSIKEPEKACRDMSQTWLKSQSFQERACQHGDIITEYCSFRPAEENFSARYQTLPGIIGMKSVLGVTMEDKMTSPTRYEDRQEPRGILLHGL